MKITVKKDKLPERKLKAVVLSGHLYLASDVGCVGVCSPYSLGEYVDCLDAVSIYEGDTIEITF